jgi:hypothetical protein
MEHFLIEDTKLQESLIESKKRVINLPHKNLGKELSIKRKDIYEGAF